MKKIFISVLMIITLTGCYYDPLYYIRRLSKSRDFEDKKEASKQYEMVIETLTSAYKSYGGLNRDLGHELLLDNQYNSAIKHLDIALEMRPNDSQIYYDLALCYANLWRIGQENEYLILADEYYEKALRISPDNKGIMYAYSQLLVFGMKNYSKAESLLEKLVNEMDVKDVDSYFLLGRVYYILEKYNKAYDIYVRLLHMKSKLNSEQKDKLDEFLSQTELKIRQ